VLHPGSLASRTTGVCVCTRLAHTWPSPMEAAMEAPAAAQSWCCSSQHDAAGLALITFACRPTPANCRVTQLTFELVL
jgi:hypothetical protein